MSAEQDRNATGQTLAEAASDYPVEVQETPDGLAVEEVFGSTVLPLEAAMDGRGALHGLLSKAKSHIPEPASARRILIHICANGIMALRSHENLRAELARVTSLARELWKQLAARHQDPERPDPQCSKDIDCECCNALAMAHEFGPPEADAPKESP